MSSVTGNEITVDGVKYIVVERETARHREARAAVPTVVAYLTMRDLRYTARYAFAYEYAGGRVEIWAESGPRK